MKHVPCGRLNTIKIKTQAGVDAASDVVESVEREGLRQPPAFSRG